MFDWMRDLYQQGRINETARSIGQARTEAGSELRALEDRVDALVLMNHALLSLLRERVGITDDDLAARMHELDMADGTWDGKMSQAPASCPGCGRPIVGQRTRCMYCGKPRSGGSVIPR